VAATAPPAPPAAPSPAGVAPAVEPSAERAPAADDAAAVVPVTPPAPPREAQREPSALPVVATVPPGPAAERTVVVAVAAERDDPAASSPEIVESTVLVPAGPQLPPVVPERTEPRELRPPAAPRVSRPPPWRAPDPAPLAQPDPEPRLEIGTIEIRLDPPPAPAQAPAAPSAPLPSGFDDYLATRSYTR
jgi:hypothetical protein